MKAAGILIGIVVAGVGAFLLIPRLGQRHESPAGRVNPPDAIHAESRGPSASTWKAPQPDNSLRAPVSKEEELRQQFSEKRIPFYRFLRENYSSVVQSFAVTEDLDTLDLVVKRTDSDTLQMLVTNAVGPNAKEYGFRKVRFFATNRVGAVNPVTLIAESTYDGASRWTTFQK